MRIFKYLKKYWFFAILAPLFMAIEVLMDLELVDQMRLLVNEGVLKQNMDYLLQSSLKMVGILVIGVLTGVFSGVFTNLAAQNYGNDLRKEVFSKVINLSYEQTDAFSTGSLVTRLTNDINQVQNMVQMSMRMLVRTFIQFIGGVVMLVTSIGMKFGVVLFIALPLLLGGVIFFIFKVAPLFKKVQMAIDDVNSVVQENVTGTRVVKAYVKEDYEADRFYAANKKLYDMNLNVGLTMSSLWPLITLVMAGSMIGVMFIGGNEIISGLNDPKYNGVLVGDIMAAVNFITMIIMGFMMFAMMFQFMIRGVASISRLNEVLDEKGVIVSGNVKESEIKGEIEFKNVYFAYPGSEKEDNVLKNISFKVNKGEVIGILGATGCGKTSLVSLITRFYDVVSGEVLVDGINVKEYDLNVLRENKVRIVMQKAELFSGTIKDNILWGKDKASDEEVTKAALIAQADGFIREFKEGYDTFVAEKGASLSGGQKQRISIARALIGDPEILIFDDSTSALDLKTEADLYKKLAEDKKETTRIIIAQRVASVLNADRILVLNDGEIEAFDTHENLLKTSSTYKEIYNSQLKRGDN